MSGRQFQTRVIQILTQLLDPGLCIGCGQQLGKNKNFCPGCASLLKLVHHPCTFCGAQNLSDGSVCAVCLFDPPGWQKIVAPMIYQGLGRDLLLRLKFSQSTHLAHSLSLQLLDAFQQSTPKPEVLFPVPLHRLRHIKRGYNQAYEIARILSQRLAIKLDNRSLRRVRHTQTQSGLSANQREKNILHAFSFENLKNYRHVAIVDDIVTTGSTANEIARTLHQAGVANVEIWGLARVLNLKNSVES